MKFCPKCGSRYTDHTLQFCLQDGTPLAVAAENNDPPTVAFGESETIVSPKRNEPLRFDLQEEKRQTVEQNRTTESFPPPPEPKKSNTFLIVLTTVFVMLLLFGAIGAGVLYYLRNQREIAANSTRAANQGQNQNQDQNSDSNAGNRSNAAKSPTPANAAKPNANSENVAPNTAKTPVSPEEKEKIKTDVTTRINAWRSDGEAINLDSYMQNYAPTVDYYNKKGATNAQVRSDKQKAFNLYETMEVKITNLKVTTDDAGETATAVFDKEWVFDSPDEASTGKVQQEIKLKKINNKWLITSERDLKLYYKD